jgi:hypothetical protein
VGNLQTIQERPKFPEFNNIRMAVRERAVQKEEALFAAEQEFSIRCEYRCGSSQNQTCIRAAL